MHRYPRLLAAFASFVGASVVACQSNEAREPTGIRGLSTTAAATNKGHEARCDTILITAPVYTVAVGGTVQYTANVYSKNDKLLDKVTVAWSSFNPSVAVVNSTGIVTGVSSGSTIIRATCSATAGLGDRQINVQ